MSPKSWRIAGYIYATVGLIAITVIGCGLVHGQERDNSGWEPQTRMRLIAPTSFKPRQLTFDRADIANEAIKSICMVKSPGGTGSGVYLSRGLVLTAYHVVRNEPVTYCEFKNERIKVIEQQRCKFGHDVAILRLESIPKGVPEQKLASDPLTIGERVYLAGFDHSDPDRLRIYDGKKYKDCTDGTIDIQGIGSKIAIYGNSGGPVWNSHGEIVTVISSRCPVGTPITSGGQIVDRVKVGVTGCPSADNVREFVKRVLALPKKDETGEQLISGFFGPRRSVAPQCPQCPTPTEPIQPNPTTPGGCCCGKEGPAGKAGKDGADGKDGQAGSPGPPGMAGKDAFLTDEEKEAFRLSILNDLKLYVEGSPAFKGEKGDPGAPGSDATVDIDTLVGRLPPIEAMWVDSENRIIRDSNGTPQKITVPLGGKLPLRISRSVIDAAN